MTSLTTPRASRDIARAVIPRHVTGAGPVSADPAEEKVCGHRCVDPVSVDPLRPVSGVGSRRGAGSSPVSDDSRLHYRDFGGRALLSEPSSEPSFQPDSDVIRGSSDVTRDSASDR